MLSHSVVYVGIHHIYYSVTQRSIRRDITYTILSHSVVCGGIQHIYYSITQRSIRRDTTYTILSHSVVCGGIQHIYYSVTQRLHAKEYILFCYATCNMPFMPHICYYSTSQRSIHTRIQHCGKAKTLQVLGHTILLCKPYSITSPMQESCHARLLCKYCSNLCRYARTGPRFCPK